MIATSHLKVFAYPHVADLRKGYNGLWGLVTNAMGHDPLEGHLYLFTNRKRDKCKILHFDGNGLCIYQKRLEKGRFPPLWARVHDGVIQLTSTELQLYLQGCTLVALHDLKPTTIDL